MIELIESFANNIVDQLRDDDNIIGVTAGGSWLTNQLDKYSDLDLILVTERKISDEAMALKAYAKSFGDLLNCFTGEHVGDPRLLICLYDNPLLHVDLKFLDLTEFEKRVEDPVILLDSNNKLKEVISRTKAEYPYPNYQWIEDRFWIWVHYTLLKIGRGELFEAIDVVHYFNASIIGPLLHIKNGNLPRGVRKVEFDLLKEDFNLLKNSVPLYEKKSILDCLENCINNYRVLRGTVFPETINMQGATEKRVMAYFVEIREGDVGC